MARKTAGSSLEGPMVQMIFVLRMRLLLLCFVLYAFCFIYSIKCRAGTQARPGQKTDKSAENGNRAPRGGPFPFRIQIGAAWFRIRTRFPAYMALSFVSARRYEKETLSAGASARTRRRIVSSAGDPAVSAVIASPSAPSV